MSYSIDTAVRFLFQEDKQVCFLGEKEYDLAKIETVDEFRAFLAAIKLHAIMGAAGIETKPARREEGALSELEATFRRQQEDIARHAQAVQDQASAQFRQLQKHSDDFRKRTEKQRISGRNS